jgi:serine/threonine protein kinase/Tol biopolymer transport system component
MSGVTEHLTSALADRYRVERELGQGGMATVYLAHDVKHDRKVAIKVLKPELAAVLGADRFVVEIKTTAALQHPNILPLFDSGEADGFLFYVMPFIDGETLRTRLDRDTQLGVDESVRIACDVADALEYAHQHGVIHRDIKPENILLQNGRPMVADFGIALAVSAAAGGRMTETGLSLGTPHYMSPEQATAEKEISARSDVFSLASVLYEMLAGQPPHVGGSAQQIIMKIITEQPAVVTQFRKSVPTNVAHALANALEKLPADRFESAAKFADALRNPAYSASRASLASAASTSPRWHRYAGPIIAILAVVAIASMTLALRSGRGRGSLPLTRLSLAFPASQRLAAPGGTRLAWAPDGNSFLYVGPGAGGTQLWRRSLDALDAVAVQGTDGATGPFFSPDGSRFGFISLNPFAIRLVAPSGANSTVLVRDSVSGGGASWGDDGFIYFDGLTTLSRIRPDGSGRETIYTLDSLQREVGVAWPEALPGGAGVLFRIRRIGDAVADFRIMAADPRTKKAKFVVRAAVARYAPSGHLLYVTSDGSLMASRFDLRRLELTGTPVLLWRGLGLGAFGVADIALAPSGALLYTTDDNTTIAEPTWVTRDGAATPVDTKWQDGLVYAVALSPDGSHLAVEFINAKSTSSNADIWTRLTDAGALSRLTFEGTNNQRPKWSRDGRDVFFLSNRGGLSALYRQRADGSSPARIVASDRRGLGEGFESPDESWLILRSSDDVCCDIMGMRPGVDATPVPLVASPAFRERSPALSSDGRWLAYASDETGRFEVFVRPFPDVGSGKWQISTAGGTSPQWSRRGDELYFLDGANDMQAMRVTGKPTFNVLERQRLFSANGYFVSPWAQAYDVSPDGKRFLMLRVGSSSSATSGSMVLVQNFLADLQRKVP